ncbi:MAG: CvpA family protein [Firmicutes bacterium]|jgi:uncharacterized membrane protein required for colicin V production|nr:CvpA family protein [Bacillota bacterium]
MNWIDIFCLLIIGISSLIGLFRGFILSFFGIVSYVIAFFFTREYYSLFAKYLAKMDFVDGIRSFFQEKLQGLSINGGNLDFSQMDAVPKFLGRIAGKSDIFEKANGNLDMAKLQLADSMTDTTVNVISFILLFILSILILTIVVRLLDSVFSLPILKEFNKLVGLVFGGIRGVLIVMVIFALVPPIDSVFSSLDIIGTIYSSKVGVYFYEYNLVYMIIDLFI